MTQDVTTGGNLGNRLPTKQRKESKAVVHPNMSINITEEALKRGKMPIEVVAKNVL
jgi:serine/threonine protein kinase